MTWRRIQFEISPDEAGIGDISEAVEPAPLDRFGLPDVDAVVGIAMRFQIAQKLHAASDPHDPPTSLNDRPRDIPDLLALRDLARETGSPTLAEIRNAAVAVFDARAAEAIQLGRTPRYWPPILVGYAHWDDDYRRSAASAGLELPLDEAIEQANTWVTEITDAS